MKRATAFMTEPVSHEGGYGWSYATVGRHGWRLYELQTNRPLFVDRDSIFRYDFSAIGYERRSGYSYHGTWPASLLAEDYPAWRAKHSPTAP